MSIYNHTLPRNTKQIARGIYPATTLDEWLGERAGTKRILHPTGAIQVFSREPSLWHLSDYIVSSVCGEFVWLCPVWNACSIKLHPPPPHTP